MEVAPRLLNLLAVPSYHFDPVFAAHVRDAFESFRPTAVAVECPAALEGELAWAAECWPAPVGAWRNEFLSPFVPGDSMFEAYRLARAASIPVHSIDLAHDQPIDRAPHGMPGAECAQRVGGLFLETVTALAHAAGPPAAGDLERERFMASRLAELMANEARVLWVGGMAHWARLRARLVSGDHDRIPAERARTTNFRRLRLGSRALFELTGRIPFLVARYAADPAHYDEAEAIRALVMAAIPPLPDRDVTLVRPGAQTDATAPEPVSTADVVRLMVYARNLAMARGLGDRPSLFDLLDAASAIVGNRYAGRLFTIAMREPELPETLRSLPTLERRSEDDPEGYRVEGRTLRVRTRWSRGVRRSRHVSLEEVQRRDAPFGSVTAADEGDRLAWRCYPPDEEAYEAFVQYVLRRATTSTPTDPRTSRFQSGLCEGIDVRATIRDWRDGNVFVREAHAVKLHVTNGVIDFANESEATPLLRGDVPAGWADPSLLHVGSASRNARSEVLVDDPLQVRLMHRELSFVTLDHPNWCKDDERTFYRKVIKTLLDRERRKDLYDWLEVMFRYCAGKPFAYFSRYTPSARIHRLAAAYRVRIVHYPLSRIPRPLLERNRSFRFMHLTKPQWNDVRRLVAEGRNVWGLG